jgi:hypothetical protein
MMQKKKAGLAPRMDNRRDRDENETPNGKPRGIRNRSIQELRSELRGIIHSGKAIMRIFWKPVRRDI